MTREEARQQFKEIIQRSETALELDRAALIIAAEDYPSLVIQDYLAHLDILAEEVQLHLPQSGDPLNEVTALAAQLFYEGRFNGNVRDYFDARNSFLNEVLDRGKGIPITLSVIFIEVARRLGLQLFGAGMPGHFLVKFCDDGVTGYFDPFNGGRLLTEEQCRQMVEELYQGQLNFEPSFLFAVTKKQLLTRMLQNLKNIYANQSDLPKLLGVIERLLLLNPDSVQEIRDRGLTCLGLKRFAQARADLETYLKLYPQAEDKDKIREVLRNLQQQQAQLN